MKLIKEGASLGATLGAVWLAISGYSSLSAGSTAWAPEEKQRNDAAFANLPADDARRILNAPNRMETWNKRHAETSRQIYINRQPLLDWIPLMGYRPDLRATINRINIAQLPQVEGEGIALEIGDNHGCLLTPWEKTARANADDARILLDAFNARSHQARELRGTYTLAEDGKTTKFTPLKPGQDLSCRI